MSDVYEPMWVEAHWKQLRIVLAVIAVTIIFLVFLSIAIISQESLVTIPILVLGYAIIIAIYSILKSSPPGATAKERLDRDRLRLSLYIEIIGDILAASESPVETFHELIAYFVSIKRFTDTDLSLILSHFAGRADEVGKEVRKLIRDGELDTLSGS